VYTTLVAALVGTGFQNLQLSLGELIHFYFEGSNEELPSGPVYDIQLWHAGTGKPHKRLAGDDLPISDLAFTPDSRYVVSITYDAHWFAVVRFWDVVSGRVASWFRPGGLQAYMAFSPDGRRLATAGDDGKIKIWDVKKLLKK
jgi:WD40 repeat protein